jgi:hypothetical protein
MARERTYIMIKPDGVQRGLVGEIIKRFEQKGFKLVALKLKTVRSTDQFDCNAPPAITTALTAILTLFTYPPGTSRAVGGALC